MRDAIYKQLLSRQAVKDYNTNTTKNCPMRTVLLNSKSMEFATESVCEQMEEVKEKFTWNRQTHLFV